MVYKHKRVYICTLPSVYIPLKGTNIKSHKGQAEFLETSTTSVHKCTQSYVHVLVYNW